jgi:hypothetical protein
VYSEQFCVYSEHTSVLWQFKVVPQPLFSAFTGPHSARCDRLEPTEVFLEHVIALHICMAFQILQNVSALYKAACGHLIAQIFLLRFLAILCPQLLLLFQPTNTYKNTANCFHQTLAIDLFQQREL